MARLEREIAGERAALEVARGQAEEIREAARGIGGGLDGEGEKEGVVEAEGEEEVDG
ncbi:MAG: hypothetical protein INR71_12785 [Terriglobus roseus]|nr:hypothetical protein [Terriglobus roseus]